MAKKKVDHARKHRQDGSGPRVLVPIYMHPDLRQRFKVAAAEEGTTYAGLLDQMLAARQRKLLAAMRKQVHPLHLPSAAPVPVGR